MSKERLTSINCPNCNEGFILDCRFVIKDNNQPKWKCENDLHCNYSKKYGQSFSWASWDSLPSQITNNESKEEKSARTNFEKQMVEKIDQEIRDEQAREAIKNSLPRIGRLDN